MLPAPILSVVFFRATVCITTPPLYKLANIRPNVSGRLSPNGVSETDDEGSMSATVSRIEAIFKCYLPRRQCTSDTTERCILRIIPGESCGSADIASEPLTLAVSCVRHVIDDESLESPKVPLAAATAPAPASPPSPPPAPDPGPEHQQQQQAWIAATQERRKRKAADLEASQMRLFHDAATTLAVQPASNDEPGELLTVGSLSDDSSSSEDDLRQPAVSDSPSPTRESAHAASQQEVSNPPTEAASLPESEGAKHPPLNDGDDNAVPNDDDAAVLEDGQTLPQLQGAVWHVTKDGLEMKLDCFPQDIPDQWAPIEKVLDAMRNSDPSFEDEFYISQYDIFGEEVLADRITYRSGHHSNNYYEYTQDDIAKEDPNYEPVEVAAAAPVVQDVEMMHVVQGPTSLTITNDASVRVTLF